ncbi:MAG: HpcH/HpaI aldolase family protein [Thermoplasmata archaeon]
MHENQVFREFLKSSRTLLAPLISISDPSITEMISYLSPDFVIVDMEHSVIDVPALQQILIASKPMHVVARIRGLEKNEIKKVLDTGVSGIIIPGIENSDEVREAVAFSKTPPTGIRGVGPGRASRYGYGFREYVKESNESLVIVQIETKSAFESIEDIVSIPGIDGCFIGPVDLSTSLQIEFSWQNREFVSVVDRILEFTVKRNLITGIYFPLSNRNPSPILERKFNFLMFGTDREAIQLKYLESMESIRNMMKTRN